MTAPIVVLSPHLDDAALSLGGSILGWVQAGHPVLVATVCTADAPAGAESRSPLVADLHLRWGGGNPYRSRRAEDRAAMARLGVRALHLGWRDAIYRCRIEGTPEHESRASLFDPAIRPEEGRVARLARGFSRLDAALGRPSTVVAPLGLGDHQDHRIVHEAARWAFEAARLVFYEDLPYASALTAEAVTAAARMRAAHPLPAEIDVAAKCRVLACYASQIPGLFGDATGMARAMEAYATRRGGPPVETLWVPASRVRPTWPRPASQ